jgi:hypothetical protein
VKVSASDIASRQLSFIGVAATQSSKEVMIVLRTRAGEQVTLEEFVWQEEGAPPTISCGRATSSRRSGHQAHSPHTPIRSSR